jgi:predicted dehydrogenase
MMPIRIGVIGCGRIAQVMHLPFLVELPEFDLVALSDISHDVLDKLSDRYRGTSRHIEYAELLARDDVDAVAITTPDHAAIVEAAARAGKHVFVEKPLCFTPDEGRSLIEAVETGGVRAMVGYMRRFDPAVVRLLSELDDLGPIRIVRAIDTHGMRSVPFDIYSLAVPPESPRDVSDRLAAAIGTSDRRLTELYWILLNLGVHDFSVLRALLGAASEVTGVELLGPQHFVTALTYDADVRVVLELGFWSEHTWNDTEVEVVTDTATARLSFPNPWVKYQSTTLRRRIAGEGGTTESLEPGSYHSSYREEWLEFYRAIIEERDPLTTVYEGLADVELATRIVSAVRPEQLDALAEHA